MQKPFILSKSEKLSSIIQPWIEENGPHADRLQRWYPGNIYTVTVPRHNYI